MGHHKDLNSDEVHRVFESYGGNVSKTARHFGVTRDSIRHHLRKRPDLSKKKRAGGTVRPTLPKKGEHRAYLLTAAQNNTKVPDKLWENMLALAKHRGAQLLVGTFTYDKNSYGPMYVKAGTFEGQSEEIWFDERLLPHIRDERMLLAPGLVWNGDMNIQPTAVNPLSGLQNFNGPASGIFPHTKIILESVATSKGVDAKMNFTTGAITMVNYIKKLAGQKAEYHHTYGGLLVEVDEDGRWFARQVNADQRWRLYDLEVYAHDGLIYDSPGVESIVFGDIHARYLDPEVATIWNEGGMVDQLRPKHQIFHDVLDFRARNHHEIKDFQRVFQRHVQGWDNVQAELDVTAQFLQTSWRPWAQSIVVNSNHDRAMERWIREADYRSDPLNAEFFLDAQRAWLKAIRDGDKEFVLLEWALRRTGIPQEQGIRFLRRDEPLLIAGIEHGMHGDEGPNGTRGTVRNLGRSGRKASIADKHSASIFEGVYVAGTSSLLDLEYNHGPSSWSHSHIVTYPNGKRTIVTMRGSRWRGARVE